MRAGSSPCGAEASQPSKAQGSEANGKVSRGVAASAWGKAGPGYAATGRDEGR